MRALISGQAGIAVLLDGDRIESFGLDSPEDLRARQHSDLPYLFDGVCDLFELNPCTKQTAVDELEFAWRKDRALQLTLILLDKNTEFTTRVLAAECIDEFFEDVKVLEFVTNRLYARPLPAEADVVTAKDIAYEKRPKCFFFLSELEGLQPTIVTCRQAWEGVSVALFEDGPAKELVERIAIADGLFRHYVQAGLHKSSLVALRFKWIAHPRLKSLKQFREILRRWLQPLETKADRQSTSFLEIGGDKTDRDDEESQKQSHEIASARELKLRVDKARYDILTELERGNHTKALGFAEDLIAFPLEQGDSEYNAKSLCDLAQQAKQCREVQIQIILAKRAVELQSNDVWALTQLGDAYRQNSEFSEAVKVFQLAIAMGEGANACVARIGLAEVLKEQGKLEEAADQFEETIHLYPDNEIARNGLAESLKEQGKLDEAIAQYQETIQLFPSDEVARIGIAEMLKEQGELDESIAHYHETIQLFPHNEAARNGLAEALTEQGKLDDAVAQYEETIQLFPLSEIAQCGLAEVLKEQGKLDEAAAQFEETIHIFPHNETARRGWAKVLQEQGKLDNESAAQFLGDSVGLFPGDKVARKTTVSKIEAVRQALSKLTNNAMPVEIQSFIKSTFGIVMTSAHIANYKSDILRKAARKAAGTSDNKVPAKPIIPRPLVRVSAAPTLKTPKLKAASTGISLKDIEIVKSLLVRVGPGSLKALIDLLS